MEDAMKKHIFYSFILLLLLTATMAKAQEYTNDTLWQASVGTKLLILCLLTR
jgi:hypothetical protein